MNAAANYFEIKQLCLLYEIETSFIYDLSEHGLIELDTVESAHFIHQDRIGDLEKILRLHRDLEINMPGIASVLHLLEKIDSLQEALNTAHKRLQLYEE